MIYLDVVYIKSNKHNYLDIFRNGDSLYAQNLS